MKMPRLAIVALIALVASACAKPPQAEIDAAKAAVAKAVANADVGRYAPESLARAREALARTQSELQAKRYDKAKAAALEASAAAAKALSDAPAAKERAKDSAAALIEALKTSIPEAEKLIASAKKVKAVKLDAAGAAATLAAVKSALADAERDFQAEDYIGAQGKAEAAKTSLADLTQSISTAVQAATRKK